MNVTGPVPTTFTGESRALGVIVGNVVPQIIATIFVWARLYTRARLLRSFGSDDITLLLAWLMAFVLTVLKCVATAYGDGRHVRNIPPADAETAVLLGYIGVLLYQVCGALSKISLCLSYLRLFIDKPSRWLLWGAIVFIVAWTTPGIFIWAFQCSPAAGFYDRSIKSQCIDIWPPYLFGGVMNIFTDICLILFVAIRISGLSLPKKQKVVLMVIVTSSWLVVVAAIIRVSVSHAALLELDFTWTDLPLSLWASIELCTGLFCVSAPIIKPLVQKVIPSFLSNSSSGRSEDNSLNTPHNLKSPGIRSMYDEAGLYDDDAARPGSKNSTNIAIPLADVPTSSQSREGMNGIEVQREIVMSSSSIELMQEEGQVPQRSKEW